MTTGTKAAYAKLKGVTKAYLSKRDIKDLLEAALEPDPNKPGNKLLNFEKADALLAARRDPAQPDRRGGRNKTEKPETEESASGPKFGDVKTQRETVKLEQDMLDLLARKGETLSRRDVMDACAAAGQRLQEQLKSVSHKMAEKFATMTDARKIKTEMDDEFRKMLEAITDDLMRKLENNGNAGPTSH